MESPKERSRKIKSFFVHAVENWDAEFYAKINDDVYLNIGMQSLIVCSGCEHIHMKTRI